MSSSSSSDDDDDDCNSVAVRVAKGLDGSKRRKHTEDDDDEDSTELAYGEAAVAVHPFSLVQEPTICDGFTQTQVPAPPFASYPFTQRGPLLSGFFSQVSAAPPARLPPLAPAAKAPAAKAPAAKATGSKATGSKAPAPKTKRKVHELPPALKLFDYKTCNKDRIIIVEEDDPKEQAPIRLISKIILGKTNPIEYVVVELFLDQL
jgi:hypothetical protein